MRISDWSSDVCSSDLLLNIWLAMRVGRVRSKEQVFVGDGGNEPLIRRMRAHSNYVENTAFMLILLILVELGTGSSIWLWGAGALYLVGRVLHALGMDGMMRSEEHTSELQSLMRISYAVFCLKK